MPLRVPTPPTDDVPLGTLVASCVGVRLHANQLAELQVWIDERLRDLGFETMADYNALLFEPGIEGRREREALARHCTTGETYFFRDRGQHELLLSTILPELIERRRATRNLQIWSAGCSTGEEAYSLAMLLEELAPALDGWRVQILATDIDSHSLAIARAGHYRPWSFRAIDPARKQRFFHPDNDGWQLDSRIMQRVHFVSHDLVNDHFPNAALGIHGMDLVVCRNVLIYLEQEAVTRLAGQFEKTLSDDGYLMTGHGELLPHQTHGMRACVFPEAVLFRSKDPMPAAMPEAALPSRLRSTATSAAMRVNRAIHNLDQPKTPSSEGSETDVESLIIRAWDAANQGVYDRAREYCERAVSAAPMDPRIYYIQALMEQAQGNSLAARSLLRKVLYLEPDFIPAYLDLASIHQSEGDHARAEQAYRAAYRELGRYPEDRPLALLDDALAGDVRTYIGRLLEKPEMLAVSMPAGETHLEPGADATHKPFGVRNG